MTKKIIKFYKDLILLNESPNSIIEKINSTEKNWKESEIIVKMTKNDLRWVLEKYIKNEITLTELTVWADFLELNENIEFLTDENDYIVDIIFLIANQEINWRFTKEIALTCLEKAN